MIISFSFRRLAVVLLLVLFQCQAFAFDQQKPEGISDHNWSSLKAAVEEAKLLPADGATNNHFGHSVSLSGNRALIGAIYDDDNGTESGSAYIFDLNGGSWTETAKLTASDGGAYDYFGASINLFGNRALIGAYFDDDNGNNSGSAYVFELQGGSWVEKAKLIATDGAEEDRFGFSVSLSGDRILIGAVRDDDSGTDSGSAYVFDLTGGSWIETAKLTASDGAAGDNFGYSVSLSNDRALIGAYQDDHSGTNSGSAYVFDLQGSNWLETTKLVSSDGTNYDNFGKSVSLSGNRALIGASGDDDNGGESGSAYVYDLQGGSWLEIAKLIASDGGANDHFGVSVSLSGDRALIGAYNDDDNGYYSGSAYVFDLQGGSWIEADKLIASDGQAGENFGYSVSLLGNRALIGAEGDNDNGNRSGSAYVFELFDDLIFRNGFEFVDLIFRDGFEGP